MANASGFGLDGVDSDPLVNEGLALSVQRASGNFEFEGNGSGKQAAVDVIGRCLSSRAVD